MSLLKKIKSISDNDKIVYKNVAGAFVIKGFALVVSLLTMPAYMSFFSDQEVLGVWFTILSILTWILNFDIGIGNGLRNKLSVAFALKDYKKAREYMSSSYCVMGIFVIIISLIGFILLPYVNWNSIFNISIDLVPAKVLVEVVRYVFIGIMLQFFLRLISSILYAMQKSAINNLITLVISILQLIFVLIAPSISPIYNLKMFSVAYIFCSNLPLLVVTIILFIGPLKKCTPSIKYFDMGKAKNVLSLGGLFFVCQILYMIVANTNEFFISQYTSPGYVVDYQIYNKLFTLGSMIFMLTLTPIWSAVSKAIAEDNFTWVKKIFNNLKKLAIIGGIVEFALIPFLQIIINFWLGNKAIEINYFYAFSFALFGTAMIFQTALSTIANGTGRIRVQAVLYGFGILVKILIIHFGIIIFDSWIVVVIANFIVILPYCIVQYIDLSRYIKRNTI